MMYYHVYLRKGTVYLPTMAKTEAGFYMNVEPVAVMSVTNTERLRNAFRDVMARGNAVIATPKRNAFPPSLLPKYAGVKTEREFMHSAAHWAAEEKNGNYQIIGYRVHGDGYWVQDAAQKINLPVGTTAGDVIERLIAILQGTA
jgi:hypothetical protein